MKIALRLILSLLIGGASIFAAAPAHADFGEHISSYAVDVVITEDGRTTITEKISYDFGNSDRHGIYRSIPMWDDLPNDRRRTYDIVIDSVLMDGNTVEVEEIEEDPFLTLKVGSADVTLNGIHEYEIAYVINNALTTLTKEDVAGIPTSSDVQVGDIELYWDVIGSEWNVPIDSVVVTVTTQSVSLISACYAEQACEQTVVKNVATYLLQSLDSFSPVTIVSTQSRDAFTSLNPADIGPRPDTWFEQFSRTAIFGVLVAIVIGIAIVMWARRRASTIKTVKVVDFVRFEAPRDMAAAEVAAAWKGNFDARALTSAIVQLSADGVLTLDTNDDKLIVTIKDASKAKSGWAQQLVSAISRKGTPASLGEYDENFTSDIAAMGSELVENAKQSGILNPKANRSRVVLIVWMVLSVVSLIFVMPMIAAPTIFGFVFLIPLASFIAFAIGYRVTPRVETETSAEFLSEVLGFEKLFTTDAATARREFAHRSGLTPAAIFATLLPFAIVYEAEESWVGAFPDLTPEDLQPYGYNVLYIGAMSNLTHNAESALSSAMTSPSSSGSGSSGGSAGGGGGGGGGGSW